MTAHNSPGLYREQALYHYEQWGFEQQSRQSGEGGSPGFVRIIVLYFISAVCVAIAGLVIAGVRVAVTGPVTALVVPDGRRAVVRIVAVFPASAATNVKSGTSLELNLGTGRNAVKWRATVRGNGAVLARSAVVAAYPELALAEIPDPAVAGLGTLPAAALSQTPGARVVEARGISGERPIWNLPGPGGQAP